MVVTRFIQAAQTKSKINLFIQYRLGPSLSFVFNKFNSSRPWVRLVQLPCVIKLRNPIALCRPTVNCPIVKLAYSRGIPPCDVWIISFEYIFSESFHNKLSLKSGKLCDSVCALNSSINQTLTPFPFMLKK